VELFPDGIMIKVQDMYTKKKYEVNMDNVKISELTTQYNLGFKYNPIFNFFQNGVETVRVNLENVYTKKTYTPTQQTNIGLTPCQFFSFLKDIITDSTTNTTYTIDIINEKMTYMINTVEIMYGLKVNKNLQIVLEECEKTYDERMMTELNTKIFELEVSIKELSLQISQNKEQFDTKMNNIIRKYESMI